VRAALALLVLLGAVAGCAAPEYEPGKRRPLAAPPDVVLGEERFDGKDGVKLLARSWRAGKGAPRATLAVVHGLKDHGDRYAPLGEALARRGFAVHALDLRGHGDSEGDRVRVDDFDDYLDDLDLFLARVRAAEPGRPLFLFGHSMGGAIVALHAIERKPEARGLVLSAPALKPGDDVSGFLIAVTGFLGTVFPTMAVLELEDEAFSRDAAVVEDMRRDPLIYGGAGPARTARELLDALERIGERMEDVETPFLVLHGTDDRLTNPDGSRELWARARSKDRTLRLYGGLFHDLLHEPEKAVVLEDVARWLEARAAR